MDGPLLVPLLGPQDHAMAVHGDCRLVWPAMPVLDVVLTDPPYVWFDVLVQLEQDGTDMELWPITAVLAQWFPLLLRRTRRAVWWVSDDRYTPYYARHQPSSWRRWPLTPTGLYRPTLHYIGAPLLADPPEAVLAGYRYGERPPVSWWADLLALLPDAGGEPRVLCDPFCGEGNGLLAGLAAGYRVIGVELDEPTYDVCVARLRACVPSTTGVYFSPIGPRLET